MMSVKGTFEDGVARPQEPVEGYEGQPVIITFLSERLVEEAGPEIDADWDQLMQVIDDHAIDTGIIDLAHQHDHYLHGTPKRD